MITSKAPVASAKASSSSTDGTPLGALFEHALKDMYYAEKKIYKSLPKMIKAASDPALKEALMTHREETAEQIEVSLLRLYKATGAHAAASEQYAHYASAMRDDTVLDVSLSIEAALAESSR